MGPWLSCIPSRGSSQPTQQLASPWGLVVHRSCWLHPHLHPWLEPPSPGGLQEW